MKPCERMTMLLNKEIPDRMGLFEQFWPETIPNYWVNEGYPEGEDPADVFEFDLDRTGNWLKTESFPGAVEIIEEADDWHVIKDGRGAMLKKWKHKSGTPEHIGFTVIDQDKWAEYREPLLSLDRSRYDAAVYRERLEQIRSKDRLAVCGNMGFVELLRATLGDMVWLPALLTDPDWIHDINSVYLAFFRTHYAALFEEAGLPDAFWLFEDLGFTNGLWCSPQTYQELFLPYYKELVGFFRDYGLPVLLHTCGDIRQAVPMIIEAGFDCIQAMEAKAGNNVVEFGRQYGNQISYMGNIDVTVLNTNDRDKVREEVLGKLKALKEMRIPYVFHSDHSIPPDVRFDTYCYALELLREHGNY